MGAIQDERTEKGAGGCATKWGDPTWKLCGRLTSDGNGSSMTDGITQIVWGGIIVINNGGYGKGKVVLGWDDPT
jgi:hypothetical protein